MGSEGTARPGFAIRAFDPAADATQVAEILREAREAAAWSEQALRETALLPGISAFVSERAGAVSGISAFVSERAGAVSGIVIGRQVLDEAEILNLAVSQAARRQGEGRALVRRALQLFAERQVSRVFLEVRESNTGAIAFYSGLGFQAVSVRKDYYQDPRESATVMELWLRKSTD